MGMNSRFWVIRFLASLGLVVGAFFGVIGIHLAAGVAVVWGGPLAGLAVYALAIAAFLTWLTSAT